jgi:hypothetical protein
LSATSKLALRITGAGKQSNPQFSREEHAPKILGTVDRGSLRRVVFDEASPDRLVTRDDIDLKSF